VYSGRQYANGQESQQERKPFCSNGIDLVGQQGLEPWTDGL
jgi:hypothetical protein